MSKAMEVAYKARGKAKAEATKVAYKKSKANSNAVISSKRVAKKSK